MKNAFFKREHLFRRTFLLYCYYDYRGYRLLLLKIICYCMIQSHNRVKACAHLYTRSCLHWYRNSEHILIQQICSHITDIVLHFEYFFVCYYSWGKICGIMLFLFNGSGPNMNAYCICWVSLFVLSKMPFFKYISSRRVCFWFCNERKSWSTFGVTLVCTQQWLLWKMACVKNKVKNSQTNRDAHKTHTWTSLNLQRPESEKHNWVCIGLFFRCLLLYRIKNYFTCIFFIVVKTFSWELNLVSFQILKCHINFH